MGNAMSAGIITSAKCDEAPINFKPWAWKRREYDQISEIKQPIAPISLKDLNFAAQASD